MKKSTSLSLSKTFADAPLVGAGLPGAKRHPVLCAAPGTYVPQRS